MTVNAGALGDDSWRARGVLFDGCPDNYADGRPGYPAEVFRILDERCGLGVGSRVLEVGPGTGQASIPILRMGGRMTLVEPGPALAERLAHETDGMDARVIVETFEAAQLPTGVFDLVVSATAFHWVNPQLGFAKCASVLSSNGWLALWWNVFGDDARPDPFQDALHPILLAKAPQLLDEGRAPMAYALDVTARVNEFTSTGRFGPVEQIIVPWEGRHSPAEARRIFSTFAAWLALDHDTREELLDDVEDLARNEFAGLVIRPYQTVLYISQRHGGRA